MNQKDQYESLACNCVDVGTLISEDDTQLALEIRGDDIATAQEKFSQIEKKARSIGSGKCAVQSEILNDNGFTIIKAMLDFDCTAEKLIFEMQQR
ncbi:hypothetical protein EOPP23_03765 [Endozoicomonas sp. OPT23]|uniref:DUF406 family protein n=1 Tax=Endozoicomonas sp. OPT23 TaxID=2072845 RepID=UPI00129A2CC4|nr:DUF406 family protein [Endozoicomonas sp. OPT23]MRI32111.1 hypothetical protein [Endozoicomonas sp. OPT23]